MTRHVDVDYLRDQTGEMEIKDLKRGNCRIAVALVENKSEFYLSNWN